MQVFRNGTNPMNAEYQPIAPSLSLTLIETGMSGSAHSDARTAETSAYRSDSRFVAHLLAVRHDVPGMRLKRRATAAQAIQAYGAASMQPYESEISMIGVAA